MTLGKARETAATFTSHFGSPEAARHLRIKTPPLSARYVLDESLGCATVGEVR